MRVYRLVERILKKIEKNSKKVLTDSTPYNIIILALRNRANEQTQETKTGCGSAWLERLIWDQEVAGSNPVTPTYNPKHC